MTLHVLKFLRGGSMPTTPLDVPPGASADTEGRKWCTAKGVEFVAIAPFVPLSLCAAPAPATTGYEL